MINCEFEPVWPKLERLHLINYHKYLTTYGYNFPRTILGRVQLRLIVCVCVCLSVCVSVRHHLYAYISVTNKGTIMKLGRYVESMVRLIVLKISYNSIKLLRHYDVIWFFPSYSLLIYNDPYYLGRYLANILHTWYLYSTLIGDVVTLSEIDLARRSRSLWRNFIFSS